MEYRSSDPDIDVPQSRLDEFVLDAVAAVDPTRVALHDGESGQEIRYGQIAGRVAALASALADRGVGPGDIVAVHLPNGADYPIVLLAVSACGATSTLVGAGQALNELRTQMLITGAGTLITHADLLGVSGPAAAAVLLEQDRFIVIGTNSNGSPDPVRRGCPPYTPYERLLATPAAHLDAATDVDPATHPVCLPFSSGTTGVPKPVVLSHRALVANALQFRAALGLPEPQRTLAFLPFNHVYALTTGLIGGLVRGDTIVTLRRFSMARARELLTEQRITLAYIVPPVATALASHPGFDAGELASLRVIVSGAAALNPTVAHAICDRLDVEIVQGYGLTEMAPVTHVMRLGAGMPIDSVGTALPGVRFRVVDHETGADVDPPPPGGMSARGELLVRGPNAMLGYLGRPDATAEVVDAAGWIHTGDLVTVDDQGCIRVVDRLKEVLKNRGFQVPPAELESMLREYPGVADAAVTGVRGDDASDERPFALVVRIVSAGSGPSEEGLLRYVADRTAEYKHLVGVAFVDHVPRSEAGKILRRQLIGLLPADRVPSRV